MSEQVTPHPFTILVVDDNPANLSVIVKRLELENFQVLVAQDGPGALRRASYAKPDLILLDVLMPGMNGFEVCAHLQRDPSTSDIPVILMTALTSTEDKVRGFDAGAVDYVTKPVQQKELLARIRLHLRVQELTNRLEEKNNLLAIANQQLEEQVRQRTAQLTTALGELKASQLQLIQQEKMSTLGQLVAGVAHEINNPVNFVYGNLAHVQEYAQSLVHLVELYQKTYPTPTDDIKAEAAAMDLTFIQEDLPKLLASMQAGAERIHQIVLSLRNFSRLDEAEYKAVDLHDGIDSTLLILQHRLKGMGDDIDIQVVRDYQPLPPVECYAGQLNQAFMNILTNAIDALEQRHTQSPLEATSPPPSRITIRTAPLDADWVEIAIADTGCGIPPHLQQKIFEPFFTTKPIGKGTGLGMSIAYQIVVQKHGGELECHSMLGQGTEFVIRLPIHQNGGQR